MAAKKKAKVSNKVRTIGVMVGDAFNPNNPIVVTEISDSGVRAIVCYADSGRVSKIAISRLQREYARLGVVATLSARRAVAKRMAGRAKRHQSAR